MFLESGSSSGKMTTASDVVVFEDMVMTRFIKPVGYRNRIFYVVINYLNTGLRTFRIMAYEY